MNVLKVLAVFGYIALLVISTGAAVARGNARVQARQEALQAIAQAVR